MVWQVCLDMWNAAGAGASSGTLIHRCWLMIVGWNHQSQSWSLIVIVSHCHSWDLAQKASMFSVTLDPHSKQRIVECAPWHALKEHLFIFVVKSMREQVSCLHDVCFDTLVK